MKTRVPRRLRVIRWSGAVLCALILALGLVSLRWSIVWEGRCASLAVRKGSVYVWLGQFARPNGWSIAREWSYRSWWLDFLAPRIQSNHAWLPLWIPFVLVGAPLAVAWGRERARVPPGHCRKCGYDLTGNISGRCPECGTTV